MDGFGCFFRVNNLEFDFLWLSLKLSVVGAGFMLFLSSITLNILFVSARAFYQKLFYIFAF